MSFRRNRARRSSVLTHLSLLAGSGRCCGRLDGKEAHLLAILNFLNLFRLGGRVFSFMEAETSETSAVRCSRPGVEPAGSLDIQAAGAISPPASGQ